MPTIFEREPAFFGRVHRKRFPLPDLPNDEMVRYVWDVEDIRDLMSKRAWMQSNFQRQEELDQIWVCQPENLQTASYGSNWGFYVGKQEIKRWYVDEFRQHLETMKSTYQKAHSDLPASLAQGCCCMFPTTTPLIRVARDGKNAKGVWYVIGQRTTLSQDGIHADARWISGRLFGEFIKEPDGWKLWHLLDLNDMNYEAGGDFSQVPTYVPRGTDIMEIEFGKPTLPMLVHDTTYNWADNYPNMPEPYETYIPEESYGPEGHPIHCYKREVSK